jgi:hypothetical protein
MPKSAPSTSRASGDLVTFDFNRSYQVVDVLWHANTGGKHTLVTITACERDWHQHIRDVVDDYQQRQRT